MKNKNKIDILHINHNSFGTEGLYEDGIVHSLSDLYKQEIFVHSDFPINYGHKLFFKFASKLHLAPRTLPLQVVKFFDLCFDWVVIYLYIWRIRPSLVNLSLLSRFMLPERMFVLAVCKLKGVKVALTCHDVIPFGSKKDKVIAARKKVINSVDYLIIHSKSSLNDLINTFAVDSNKVVYHPFPLMDFSRMMNVADKVKDVDFLFTGYIREEKGIFVLLDAWKEFHKTNISAKLVIAGAVAVDNFNIEQYSNLNIEFKLYFLSPEEYIDYLTRSKCVVLPYLHGTNSGILYSALATNCSIITSDIPMFKSNPIVGKENMFKSGDSADLLRLLKSFNFNIHQMKKDKADYNNQYKDLIRAAYQKMMDN